MDHKSLLLILLNFMLISLTALFSLGKIDLFWKQYFFWIIGFFLFFSGFFLDYRLLLEKYYYFSIVAFSFVILILVLFTSGYPKSWFNLGIFSLQPAEFSKIGFFLLFAYFLTYYQTDLKKPFYLVFSFLTLLPYIFLILLQPDFGMAFLYFLTWFFLIPFFLNKKTIVWGVIFLIISFVFLWFFVLKDYQKNRILALINPEVDPLKSGYNLRQIRIALSTSSFFGKGVGLSDLGRSGLLPSSATDFILTFLIEERGFLIFVIYFFLFFGLLRILILARKETKNPLIQNIILVTISYFLARFSLTTLVNFGIFPIIGLPVPFLSYGGSHLISDLWFLGIILSWLR